MDAQEGISTRVNQLLKICHQRTNDYKYIADNINDLQLQTIFDQYSRQAAVFVEQLSPYVALETSSHDEIQPKLSEGLIKELNEAVEQGNALELLYATVQEEANAINGYEQVLREKLSDDLTAVLESQLEKVKASQNNFQLYLKWLKNVKLN